ncbi:hypothetical protein [Weissella hellenica]|uniref:Acyltransferase n=2 Tax=Weissella hellenica TaxID=46256 RepID=A0A4Y4G4G7_WEIHE|nr:hypothetical protein [Weissella hellenica]NKY67392.1 hypothetical protein [Weissella hellenica]GED36366.1 hypothetical protein WHE01_12700 [Weissella hellenica]
MDSRKKTVNVLTGFVIIMLIMMQMIDHERSMAWYRFFTWITWPAVFFIAGYSVNIDQKLIQLIKQSILRYLVPYFLISILLIGSSKVIQMFGLSSLFIQPFPAIRVGVKAMLYGNGWPGTTIIWPFETGIGLSWGLLALFWGTIIIALVIKIKPLFLQIVLVALMTYGGFYVSSKMQLPWSFTSGVVVQPFMLLGYYFKDENKAWQPARATVLAGVIISWVMAHNGSYDLTVALINHWIIGTFAAMIILEAVLSIVWYIHKKLPHFSDWLIKLGKYWYVDFAVVGYITMILPIKHYLNNLVAIEWLDFVIACLVVLFIIIIIKWILTKGIGYWEKKEID